MILFILVIYMDKKEKTTKGIVVRIPVDEHKKIKKYLFEKEISFNEYVLNLIRKDMNKKKK